ncbi:MAG TPA: sodium:proton antiporter [Anaerolineae bacterium]|nr:sodium:proton antiporter [Anaerolineae bacterium]
MPTELAIFFGLVVIYGAVAVWLGRFSITMPIVFVAIGAILGPHRFFGPSQVELLTEMTLALLLFADASSLAFRQVRDDPGPPARLLLIGLPLIVALGGLVAHGLFPGEGLGFALLLAAILAPTDAALGLPIFNNPRVPVRIRRALNVESGLNDGIATPLVALFTALAVSEEGYRIGNWLLSALGEIGIGVGAGVAAGLLGGWLFAAAAKRGWTAASGEQIGNFALALCAFWAAKALGGNGFVAAFVGGLLFGHATRERLHVATEFTEVTGTILSLFVWTVFGANLAAPLFQPFQPLELLYALLSLMVIRMIPVAISLIGTRFRADTALMMGWFGPRGLASVVFTLMAYEAFHEAARPFDRLAAVAVWAILLSVVLHGVSAVPLANWYARRLEKADPAAPELVEVPELGIRRRDPLGWLKHSH